ncbi:MAG: TonB-dependent receptor, partial [Gammaproteobacteria bacterium]|nr:TonB-dependent receptor [Gammaproteobacteria bacterium]
MARHVTWAVIVTALVLPVPGLGAEAEESSRAPEDPFFIDLPVVLTATRLSQPPQDAPAAVFVIDREMIDASGAREIADLMRLAPGFIVATDNGNRRAVGYRGFVDSYGRRLQVLIDGRSVYMPLFGGTTWTDLPLALDDIERIEVIRGPNGASYGANAFQGVVNILTRHPDVSQGLYLHAAGGDPDYRQGVLRHGFPLGSAEVRYTLGYEEDSGYDVPLDNQVDGKELGLATFDAMLDTTSRDRLRLQAGIKRGDLRDGGNDIDAVTNTINGPTVEDPPRTVDVEHLFGQIEWEHQLQNGDVVKALGYVQQLTHDDDYPTLLPPTHPDNPSGTDLFVDFSRSREERRYAVELQHLLQPNRDLRVVWGVELRQDEVESTALLGPGSPVENTLFRLFANAEWQLAPELLMNAGVMLEEHEIFDDAVSPRLALNFSPSTNHTFRIAASRSVRTPSVYEARSDEFYPLDLDFSGGGGPGIDGEIDAIYQVSKSAFTPDNETVEALELGWLFELMDDRRLRGDVRIFYERYRKMLNDYPYRFTGRDDLGACSITGGFCGNANNGFGNVDHPKPTTFGVANQIDLDFYGLEASLEARPSTLSRIIASYTLNKLHDLEARRPDLLDYPYTDFGTNTARLNPTLLAQVTDEWERSYPSHIFSLLAIHRPDDHLTLSAAVYHLSNTQFLEVGDRLPGYTRLDL